MKTENLINGLSFDTQKTVKHLRQGNSIRMYNRKTKLFTQIQLGEGIYWERWVSKDNHNWVKWNERLSLREALDIRAGIAIDCQEMCYASN